MHWTRKGILWSFHLLLFIVPLIFLPNTSELFEFNKMIVTYLLTLAILFFWLSRMAVENRLIFKKTILDWPIIIFLITQSLSLFFSIDQRTSLLGYYSRFNGGLASLLCYAVLYWSTVSNLESKHVKSLISSSLIACFLVSFWGFLEHLGIDASWWVQDVQTRVFSTLGQPNWLAAYLGALIFIPLQNYLKTKNYWSFAFFAFIFAILLFTKSRSGLLAFGLSSIIFWAIYVLSLKTKTVTNLLVIGYWSLVIILSLFLIPNPVKDLFIKSTAPASAKPAIGTSLETGGTESGSIRKIVWSGAVKIWQASAKNFWIGTGPETFAISYYQYRPVEHNQTSEWELLYNKAHNEFLNYLATTGILGLGSYLVLLTAMLISNIKAQNSKQIQNSNNKNSELNFALLCGWLTIPVTNFWGFSVVIVQILMFLLPAFVIILNQDQPKPPPQETKSPFSALLIIILVITTGYTALSIIRYWLADTYYATGENHYQAFTVTNEAAYLLSAYKNYSLAHEISPDEPIITAQLSFSAAYISLLSAESDATTSANMAAYTRRLADLAINQNPRHPNLYKIASKSMIVLSVSNPNQLLSADRYLASAQKLSPTDPRIPYNRGIIYKQLNQTDQAKSYFEQAIRLKSDFNDPKVALSEL